MITHALHQPAEPRRWPVAGLSLALSLPDCHPILAVLSLVLVPGVPASNNRLLVSPLLAHLNRVAKLITLSDPPICHPRILHPSAFVEIECSSAPDQASLPGMPRAVNLRLLVGPPLSEIVMSLPTIQPTPSQSPKSVWRYSMGIRNALESGDNPDFANRQSGTSRMAHIY